MNWECIDCGVHTKRKGDYYQVKPSAWPHRETKQFSIEGEPVTLYLGLLRGCLCIECLEARLGRTLTRDDFTDSKRNTFGTKSEILTARLNSPGTI